MCGVICWAFPMKIRCFIALEIPGEVREYILKQINEVDNFRKLKWENSSKFHITLKFLGDVEETKIEEIKSVLEKFIADKKPVRLTLDRFGAFYRDKKPKVLWAGFKYNGALADYQKELERRLSEVGFPVERRKFSPHLTLYRVRERTEKSILEKFNNHKFTEKTFTADEFLLVKSRLLPKGSVYEILERYNLKGK